MSYWMAPIPLSVYTHVFNSNHTWTSHHLFFMWPTTFYRPTNCQEINYIFRWLVPDSIRQKSHKSWMLNAWVIYLHTSYMLVDCGSRCCSSSSSLQSLSSLSSSAAVAVAAASSIIIHHYQLQLEMGFYLYSPKADLSPIETYCYHLPVHCPDCWSNKIIDYTWSRNPL